MSYGSVLETGDSETPKIGALQTIATGGLTTELVQLVGRSGEVAEEYGGYRIIATDPSGFPWRRVFETLLRCSLSTWLERRGKNIVILSKPVPI